MASLKDKLKSKINKQKNEPETMQCFDETSLNVDLIQGKSQLTELKVCSAWTNKTNIKLPKFKCKWYNRTDNNYQEIFGIEDEVYQPSVLDVDSIVEVTCIPQLPGVNYEGMPFLLKSRPIALSPQTEAEANRMMDCGKVRLIVSIKSARIKGVAVAPASQGMVVVEKQKMILSQVKFGQINDQVLKVANLQQSTPQITLNRKMTREITLKFSQEESCTLYLKNHEVRDAFYLFLQIYNAKKLIEKQETTNQIQINSQKFQHPTTTQDQILYQKTLESNQQTLKEGQIQSTTEAANISQLSQKGEVEARQKGEEPVKMEQSKQSKAEDMRQIKAMQSPKKTEQKILVKQNTSDLLQLMKFKEQIKRLQQQNLRLIKDCEHQKNKAVDLQNKTQQLNERLNNASMNYFILEKELKSKQQVIDSLNRDIEKTKNIQNNKLEQIIYYQNEIKLLKDENNTLRITNSTLNQQYQALKASLSYYQQKYSNSSSPYSYKELQEELKMSRQAQKQLKLKYEFEIEEKEKIEQSLRNSRSLIQQIECQKKCIQKKYQSLTNEITSNNLSPTLLSKYSQKMSDKSPESSLTGSMVFDEISRFEKLDPLGKRLSSQNDFREKQILELKKQIKDYVEENNLLRGVIQKQKKSSSRAHLKVELIDAKKIVSRLSESIAEKEMEIAHLKQINKQLNKTNRKLQQSLQSRAAISTKI